MYKDEETTKIVSQDMKPSSRRRRLNGVCVCVQQRASFQQCDCFCALKITDTVYGEFSCEQQI